MILDPPGTVLGSDKAQLPLCFTELKLAPSNMVGSCSFCAVEAAGEMLGLEKEHPSCVGLRTFAQLLRLVSIVCVIEESCKLPRAR